jgi:hypothetical protein
MLLRHGAGSVINVPNCVSNTRIMQYFCSYLLLQYGYTPLHLAVCMNNEIENIKLLLLHGATESLSMQDSVHKKTIIDITHYNKLSNIYPYRLEEHHFLLL